MKYQGIEYTRIGGIWYYASGGLILDPAIRQALIRQAARNQARKAKDQAMRDLSMVKVKGALGGTYYE